MFIVQILKKGVPQHPSKIQAGETPSNRQFRYMRGGCWKDACDWFSISWDLELK